jgi:sulfite reductase alpha subunit-like flavoprotein
MPIVKVFPGRRNRTRHLDGLARSNFLGARKNSRVRMGDNNILPLAQDALGNDARPVLVLYGSETGNGQDLAEEVERLFERLHYNAKAEEMNNVELVSEYLAVQTFHCFRY